MRFSQALSNKLCLSLIAFFGSFGIIINLLTKSPQYIAFVWAGMILAISFIESWLKFKAPFLPKYIGWDVGRFVFQGLNCAEIGLVLSIWLGVYLHLKYNQLYVMGGITAQLLVQLMIISPKLQLRSQFLIVEALQESSKSLSTVEAKSFEELKKSISGKSKPEVKLLHLVYILLETSKVVTLLYYAINF